MLLTSTEAAAKLKVSRTTIWRMVVAGELPAVTLRHGVRKLVRIREEALEALLRGASGEERP